MISTTQTAPNMANMNMAERREVAAKYIQANLCAIPASRKEKRPLGDWKAFQDRLPVIHELRFTAAMDAIAIVCGPISGNLEVIDFDQQAIAFDQWAAIIEVDLLNRLAISTTQSGGKHVLYRCESPVAGNQKLASRFDADTGELQTLIETRGQGGLVIAAPTAGYEITQGDLCQLPTITKTERKTLLQAAKSLCEIPEAQSPQRMPERSPQASQGDTNRPGDIFNSRGDIGELLSRHGWIFSHNVGRNQHWTRPGKDGGTSATWDGKHFYVFSSNAAPFEPSESYRPFKMLSLLDHGGDDSQAARALGEQGYGQQSNTGPQADLSELMRNTGPQDAPGCPIQDECDPEDAEDQPEYLTWRPFPVDSLPGPLPRFCKEASDGLEVDPSFIALPVLVAAAAAIGNSRVINIRDDHREPSLLWGMIIGRSGTKKSPACKKSLLAAEDENHRSLDTYKKKYAIYKADAAAYQNLPAAERRGAKEPQPPESPERFLVGDATIEALADRLQSSPRGVLLFRDEAAGWMRSFGQYKSGKGGDQESYLQMYGAAPLIIDRKTGACPTIMIERANVSILGTIQPGTLADCIGKDQVENGLAARFLFAYPPDNVPGYSRTGLSDATTKAFKGLFSKLYQLRMKENPLQPDRPSPSDISLSDDALEMFISYANDMAAAMRGATDADRACGSKLEGGAARLALVIHCLRQVAGEPVDPWVCDAQSMDAGIVLAKWFFHEARRVNLLIHNAGSRACMSRVLERVQQAGGEITAKALRDSMRTRFSKNAEAKAVLDLLVGDGQGHWEKRAAGPKGGRPSEVFVVNE